MSDYRVEGRKEDGSTVYYTGKAGQAFVSNQLCDAFTYVSLEGARRRATMLNGGTVLHGVRFMVPVGDDEEPIHEASDYLCRFCNAYTGEYRTYCSKNCHQADKEGY